MKNGQRHPNEKAVALPLPRKDRNKPCCEKCRWLHVDAKRKPICEKEHDFDATRCGDYRDASVSRERAFSWGAR